MDVTDITAGVASGLIIAAAFLWCIRAIARTTEEAMPWWAPTGAALILIWIGSHFYLAS